MNKYIFINPRTMVLDSLQNIVDRLNATQCEKVLIAKEQGIQKLQKLGEILDGTLTFPYLGSKSDLDLLGISKDIYNSTEVYNCGVFACGHKPLLVINSYIKNNEFKYIKYLNFIDNENRIFAILNTIYVKTNLAVELPEKFNVQLYHDGCVIVVDQNSLSFLYKDKKASILHFNGQKSDYKYNKLKNYALDFFKINIPIASDPGTIQDLQFDYLHMTNIAVGKSDLSSDTCVFTIAKKEDVDSLKTLLWSIHKNSKLHFPIYVFNINSDSTISAICAEHNCIEISCKSELDIDSVKCLIFGAQNVIDSNNFIYIDVNCVILESLLENYHVTLDVPGNARLEEITQFLTNPKFTIVYAVPVENIMDMKGNVIFKIDDKDFKATNPGVWCHSLHNLLDRKTFTSWDQYTKDEVIK